MPSNNHTRNTGTTIFADKLDFASREAYNVLRTNLTFTLPGVKGGKVVGITSSTPQEGKSFTAVNLSYALAKDGHKTILLSGDLRKPSIEKLFGISLGTGLSNILAGNTEQTFSQLVINVLHDNLFMVTAGDIPPNPSELMGSNEMKGLLEKLRKEYEYIIIDLPPVTSVIDPVAVSKFLDGIVLVVRHGYTKKQGLANAIEQLKFANVHILGFVYNGFFSGNSYYKKKYRYYRYKSYYGNNKYYESAGKGAKEAPKNK